MIFLRKGLCEERRGKTCGLGRSIAGRLAAPEPASAVTEDAALVTEEQSCGAPKPTLLLWCGSGVSSRTTEPKA